MPRRTSNGSAVGGVDYQIINNKTLTFPIGESKATFTVDIVNDNDTEGDETFNISLSNPSVGKVGTPSSAVVTIVDDDIPNIFVEPTKLTISEPNGSGTFRVRLNTTATHSVNITLTTTSDECSFEPTVVMLDSTNALSGTDVKVTAVDDTTIDGPQTCLIKTTNAASNDPGYSNFPVPDVTVTVMDDEKGQIFVNPTSLTVSEPDGSDTFAITLNDQPKSKVTVNLSASNGQCSVTPSSLVIDASNWKSGAVATVKAVNDGSIDGTKTCMVTTGTTSSGDANFNGLNPADVTVTVRDDGSGPRLSVNPTKLSFRHKRGDKVDTTISTSPNIFVRNAGEGSFKWRYQDNNLPWANIIEISSNNPNNKGLFIGLLDKVNTLEAGLYKGTIVVTGSSEDGSPAADSPKTVMVELEVYLPGQPVLAVAPNQLSFTAIAGGNNPAPQTFKLSNTGVGNLSWAISENVSWLSLNQQSGSAPTDVTVSVDISGLPAGQYNETLTVTSPEANNSPQTINIKLTVEPAVGVPVLAVVPNTLNFEATKGEGNPANQLVNISNSGGGNLSWTATESISWLNLSSQAGSAPGKLTLSVDLTDVAPGNYSGTVSISSPEASNSPQTVTVNLLVNDSGPVVGLNVSPKTMTFKAVIGDGNPAPQTIALSEFKTDPLNWIASEKMSWFSLNAGIGTTPVTLTATVDISGLVAGTYNGVAEFIAPSAPNSPQSTKITLIITEPVLEPKLTLTKQVSADRLSKPAVLSYTIAVKNSGQAAATGVEILDKLPTLAAYVPNSASDGGIFDGATQTVRWQNLSLNIGETITRTLQLTPTTSQGIITNTATVLLGGQAQSTDTAITRLASGVIIEPNKETELDLPSSETLIRFPAGDERFEVVATALKKPSQNFNNNVAPPAEVSNGTVCKSYPLGQTFQLNAQTLDGKPRDKLTDNPAMVELSAQLQGTANDDILFLLKEDIIRGEGGNDLLFGSAGDDTIFGNDGDDKLHGSLGNDTLDGGDGDDTLYGDEDCQTGGNDTLRGGAGADRLFGRDGDDKLFGGPGNDQLIGGAGNNIYGLAAGEGTDTIVGFIDNQDKIGLPTGVEFAELTIKQGELGAVISLKDEELAIVFGFQASLLTEDDFALNVNRSAKTITTAQNSTISDVYLFYWNGNKNQWVDAATTCQPVGTYTRTATRILVPICKPGEFTLLQVTTHESSMNNAVYLPLVVK